MAVPLRPRNSEHCFLPQAKDFVQLINIQYGKMFHVYFNTEGKSKGEVVPIHAIKACGGRCSYSSNHSEPWHCMEVSGHLHSPGPAALSFGKEPVYRRSSTFGRSTFVQAIHSYMINSHPDLSFVHQIWTSVHI